MRKYPFTIIVVLLILFGAAAIASQFLRSDAQINLIAPVTYKVGDLIVLDATESVAEQLQWTILPETKNFKIVGKTAYFSSSSLARYTVIITATSSGTLATKVFFLEPMNQEPGIKIPEPLKIEPKIIDPKIKRIKLLINGGIISSLDAVILASEKIDLSVPDNLNTFEEFKQWIDDNS